MISRLALSNFKCFDALELDLAALTLLSGFNASGKSTAIQGLLLLAQSIRSNDRPGYVALNGPYVQLGTAGEVLKDSGPRQRELSIGIESRTASIKTVLAAEDRTERDSQDRTSNTSLRIRSIEMRVADGEAIKHQTLNDAVVAVKSKEHSALQGLMGSMRDVILIGATRTGHKEVYPSVTATDPVHGDVGVNGEFAPWWLSQLTDDNVDELRCHPNESAKSLRRQLSAWFGTLFPSSQANATALQKTGLVKLELRVGDTGDWRRPANIGYGLTYALPILVAGLVAKKGQVLCIDSPEAHLHPAGQSAMGEFIAHIAASGVQTLVETHSDHVMNGVRLAVRKKSLGPQDVLFQFFSRRDLESSALNTLKVDTEGQMSEWPSGFFDQLEKDLSQL